MNYDNFITKLRKAHALIARGWAQGEDARDERGDAVQPTTPEARCWCLVGALVAAGITRDSWLFEYPDGSSESALFWNDDPERTKTDVLACIDNSIAALQTTPR